MSHHVDCHKGAKTGSGEGRAGAGRLRCVLEEFMDERYPLMATSLIV